MDFSGLKETIEQFDIITVYRHENPDCDAVGSQWGLVNWIRENWADKQVYALGTGTCSQGIWPENDTADDETVRNSLAIVLDTANVSRTDDQRFLTAQKVIKIDHHPNVEPFGDVMYVNTSAAATCEILTHFMHQTEGCTLSEKTASCLYQGLLTDTLNYQTSNTTADTLQAGVYLAATGINLPAIARKLWDRDLAGFRFSSYIRNAIQMEGDHLAYVIVPEADQKRFDLTPSECRNYVGELGHVTEFEIWVIFTEKFDEEGNQLFDASLRSKTVTINDTAAKYNGGGHKNACGVKNLTSQTMREILAELASKIA